MGAGLQCQRHRGAIGGFVPLTRKMARSTIALRRLSRPAAPTSAVLIVELGLGREARHPRPVNCRCWTSVSACVLGQVGTSRRSWSAGKSAEGRSCVATTHSSGLGMLPFPTADRGPGLQAPSPARAARPTCPEAAMGTTVVDVRETNPAAKLALSGPCKARSRCGEESRRTELAHGRRLMRGRSLLSRAFDRNATQRSARGWYVGTDTRCLALTKGLRLPRLGDLQSADEPA